MRIGNSLLLFIHAFVVRIAHRGLDKVYKMLIIFLVSDRGVRGYCQVRGCLRDTAIGAYGFVVKRKLRNRVSRLCLKSRSWLEIYHNLLFYCKWGNGRTHGGLKAAYRCIQRQLLVLHRANVFQLRPLTGCFTWWESGVPHSPMSTI